MDYRSGEEDGLVHGAVINTRPIRKRPATFLNDETAHPACHDLPRANLVLGQLRSRNLPIPAAIFAERLARSLESMRDEARRA